MPAKKKTDYSITVEISISTRKHFILQSDCAEWLGIKNSSKKAIQQRCNVLNYTVTFDN